MRTDNSPQKTEEVYMNRVNAGAYFIRPIFTAIIAIATAFTFFACGSDGGGGDDGGSPQAAKWVSVDEDGNTWILTITENTSKFAAKQLTAKQGDAYKLELESATEGNLKSEGEVQGNTSGKILLKPDNATETFEVTTNGEEMTSISGTVTFDDGSSFEFDTPYSLTPSSVPSGGGSGSWTLVADSKFGSSDNNIWDVAYGDNKFVAVGQRGKIAYSSDGINWTAVTDSLFGTYGINDITYGNNKFVAVYDSDRIAYSADGINWTTNGLTGSWGIVDIAYGNNKFVAVGHTGFAKGRIAYSEDGVIWNTLPVEDTPFDGSPIYCITYGNGKFIAGGYWGKMAYSTDGFNWTVVDNSTFGSSDFHSIAWGGNKFVAGNGGKAAYSTDGITWTSAGDSILGTYEFMGYTASVGFNGIAYGGNRFVAVGSSGGIATSSDGISWTKMAENLFGTDTVQGYTIGNPIIGVAYGGNKFVAVGENGKIAYWQP